MNLSKIQLRLLGAVLQDAVASNRLPAIVPAESGKWTSAELKALTEALSNANVGYIANREPVIVMSMEGGLLQGLECNIDPPSVRMICADFDAEDCDDVSSSRAEFTIPGQAGESAAFLWEWDITEASDYVTAVEAALQSTLEEAA